VTTTERPVTPATVAEWRRRKQADGGLPPDGHNGRSVFGHGGQSTNGHGEQPRSGRDGLPQAGENTKIRNGFRVPAYTAAARSLQSSPAGPSQPGQPVSARAREQDPAQEPQPGFAEAQQAGLAAIFSIAKAGAPSRPRPAAQRAPMPRPLAPPQEFAAGVALAQPLAIIAASAPVTEPPSTPARTAPAVPGRPPAVVRPVPGISPRPAADWMGLPVRPATLSLLVILTVQAVLSLQLVKSNTAFTDEALYLWAGHLEWAHLLHGTPIPPFPTYFSGAPVIYPPLGALADSIGGLTGARLLSLCFMLAATALLWATTSRLYGKRAGFFAAGLWAFLGPTLKLGAFATFDPMSVFLVALSAWCAVRGGGRRDFTRWIAASAAALVLANAAAYSSAIFDPVVVAIAFLAMGQEPSLKLAKMRAAALAAYVISVLILLADAGGGFYWTGISKTVLSRVYGTSPASTVLLAAWRWTAPIAVVTAAGLLICAVTERSRRTLILIPVLAAALLLVPFEQARIHTITSLDKHADLGAWFAGIVAGYAVSTFSRLRIPKPVRTRIPVPLGPGIPVLARMRIPSLVRTTVTVTAAAALVIPLTTGFVSARALFGWPNSQSFFTAFRPLAEHSTGPLLVEAPSPTRYYLGSAIPWQRWSSTWAITLPNGRSVGSSNGVTNEGIPGIYIRRIARGFFTLVALNLTTTPGLDHEIIDAMTQSHRYRFVGSAPYDASYFAGYYAIWERTAVKGSS
jgi:Dolichyl-phosphate-mannose-protein mannosyltransferase